MIQIPIDDTFRMVIYEPGDVILECEPLVYELWEEERGKRCDFCLKEWFVGPNSALYILTISYVLTAVR